MEPQKIDEIVTYLIDELGGDWFLTGGALVQLAFDSSRGTEDVDFVRIAHPDLSDEATRNQLFQWLLARNLGPEWVNPAVEPFVREVPHWLDELVLLKSGKKGRIFRPTLTLFIHLKLRRGTAVDQEDIQKAWGKCPEGFEERKFLNWASERAVRIWEILKPSLKA